MKNLLLLFGCFTLTSCAELQQVANQLPNLGQTQGIDISGGLKEALNNVVKHARATEVQLRASLSADTLQLTIADDGVGCDLAPRKPEEDGLLNMRQRIEDLGGKFQLKNRAGSGTLITFEIPLTRRSKPITDKN